MRLTRSQRVHLADKLMDSGNYALVALVLGQFVEGKIQWAFAFVGVIVYFSLLIITTGLRK